MTRPAPIAYVDHVGRLRCPTCTRALRPDYGVDRSDVGEVNSWDVDDVEPGDVLACGACGAVVYREPDALDGLVDLHSARLESTRCVRVDYDGTVWQVRDSVDRTGFFIAVPLDGIESRGRYVRADGIRADDLLDALGQDAEPGVDYLQTC